MKLDKLDKAFSEFIRRRDADENGYIRCISCGKIVHWKDADCGHFVNRKHLSVRWNEQNCNAQCRSCNRFNEGSLYMYSKGLDKKYGPGTADKLISLQNQSVKLTQFEIDTLTKFYRDENKNKTN